MSAFLDKVVLGAVMFGASWLGTYVFNSPAKAEEAVAVVQTALTQEVLERTNADTEIKGQYTDIKNDLTLIKEGLGIKYSLPKAETPKAETFSTKEERAKNKASLITGVKDGLPINE